MKRAVCTAGGCVWLHGRVCSRQCPHAWEEAAPMRQIKRQEQQIGPPPKCKYCDGWTNWYRAAWNALRTRYLPERTKYNLQPADCAGDTGEAEEREPCPPIE